MIIDTVISHMEKKLPKGMLVSRIKEKCGLKIKKHYSRGWLVGMYKLMAAIEPTTEASAEGKRRLIRRWPIEQIEELVASYRSDGAGAEAETVAAPIEESAEASAEAVENYRNDGAEAETEEEAEASDPTPEKKKKRKKTAYMKWRPGGSRSTT